MENLDPNVPIVTLASILIGVILAFGGYRLKRIAMSIIWFVIGYSVVQTYAPNLIADPFWQFVLQIAAGALLSLVGLSIEKLAVSLTAGVVVFWFALNHFGPATSWTLPAIAIAAGTVAGMIAVWMMKPAIIIFTAIEGANLIASNIITLLPSNITAAVPQLFMILFFIIFAVAASWQWHSCKNIE